MAAQRWTVFFSGRVQGVGFRFRTHTIASRFEVTGWVANLDKGDVKLVVEGQADELNKFVQEIEDQMSGFIRGTEIIKTSATSKFSRFEIRHSGL